jgi:hypothetical protein
MVEASTCELSAASSAATTIGMDGCNGTPAFNGAVGAGLLDGSPS